MARQEPDVAALVDRMPDADRPARPSKFTGPHPAAADKVFAEILSGGREALLELIQLIKDPTDPDFKNYKAAYVLHGLAVYVGQPDGWPHRRTFAETLTGELSREGHSRSLVRYLIQELQVVGRRESADDLGAFLLDDELCEPATQALIAMGTSGGDPACAAASRQVRKALPNAKGKGRITLAQAAGVLGDRGSVPLLKKTLDDPDPAVRTATAWALANIAEQSAARLLIGAADNRRGWERIQAAKACLLLAEKLLESGAKESAVEIYQHLYKTRKDSDEAYLSEVAEKALIAAGVPVAL